MKKQLLTILAVAALAGCATPTTKLTVPGIERSDAIQVKDVRPASEKKDEVFSLLITSDAYGTYRIADAALAPSAVRLFQHRSFEKFGAGQDITIHHLVAYRNLQASFRSMAIGSAIGGVVGAMVAGPINTAPNGINSALVDRDTFESLANSEYKRALYTLQENPGKGNVLIVYMDVEMRGKRAMTRTVAPFADKGDINPLTAAVEASIQFQLAQYQ